MHTLTGPAEDAQHLCGSGSGGSEPVRHLGVELGCLADTEHEVLITEDQPHVAREDVEPLEPVVGAGSRSRLRGRDHDLPGLDTPGMRQRHDGPAVHPSRSEADSRIAHLRGADQVVERHPVDLRQRQQQLQARTALSVLQPGQGALRDACELCDRRQGQSALLANPAQPGRDSVQSRIDAVASPDADRRHRRSHPRIPLPFPGNSNNRCCRCPVQRTLHDMNHNETERAGQPTDGSGGARDSKYDVAVVGGGAAGLTAALVLARARRTVVVIDAGEPRNAPAAHMHGFLGWDGEPPALLLARGRDEVGGYGGEIVTGTVTDIARGDADGPRFQLMLADGRSLCARRVLFTTGLHDELPDIPGLRERWGRDLLHCPYCHGYEVRDEPLGVLGGTPGAVQHALIVRQWSDDVVFFSHTDDLTAAERNQLTARGIRIIGGQVARLSVEDDALTGVELRDGSAVPRAAVFVRPRFVPNSDLLTRLGCATNDDEWTTVDPHGRTSVAGVWAAGNVTNPRAQVVTAAGEGSAAAIAINNDLCEEDTDREAAATTEQSTAARS